MDRVNRRFLTRFAWISILAAILTIADAGGIMPPKSTWFEPKLRDAMFCHMI